MKKGYQKRLNKLSEESLGKSLAANENSLHDELPEIDGLDQILALPQPLRENSLVKAICDAHRRRKKTKQSKVNPRSRSSIGTGSIGTGPIGNGPVLAIWQEDSSNEQNYNSRN